MIKLENIWLGNHTYIIFPEEKCSNAYMIFQRLIFFHGQKRCSKTSKEPIILYVGLMSSHFDLIEFWSYFFWTKYVGTAIKLKQKQWVVKKCLLKVNSWLAMDYFRSIVASPASRLGFALFYVSQFARHWVAKWPSHFISCGGYRCPSKSGAATENL